MPQGFSGLCDPKQIPEEMFDMGWTFRGASAIFWWMALLFLHW
jgi:hypothetical protein